MNGYSEFEKEVVDRLARIETNQQVTAAWIKGHDERVSKKEDVINTRLSAVEDDVAKGKGAVGLFAFLWGTLVAVTLWLVKKAGG